MSAPRPLLGRHRGPCHYPHSPYYDTADDANDHCDDGERCDDDNKDDDDRKESLLLNECSQRLLGRHRGALSLPGYPP